MALDVREESGSVLRPGSRFRVAPGHDRDVLSHAGPAALPFRARSQRSDPNEHLAGVPTLRVRADTTSRGQAYRVLSPRSSPFHRRAVTAERPQPEARFRLAGRGRPQVLLQK